MAAETEKPELDHDHIDALLQAHATPPIHPAKRHLGTLLVCLILTLGTAAGLISIYSNQISVTPDTDESVLPLPTATPLPTPAADPNATLPQDIRAAIAAWPDGNVKALAFKQASTVPNSVEESEALYDEVLAYAQANPTATFTLVAYATQDESATTRASLRLEYILSQLAENKVPRNRITLSTESIDSSTNELADTVHVKRNLFTGEAAKP